MAERWRLVPGRFAVEASTEGRIRFGGRVLRQQAPNADGYLRVAIAGERVYVHHLVCAAFHGERPVGMLALHRDDVKTNNRPDNLRWGTQAENGIDASRNGRARLQRLRPSQVLAIRASERPHREVATLFGVSPDTVRKIRNRTRWVWL